MSSAPQSSEFFIGWDVGGWNCDRNNKSRDALVILDAGLNIVGKPWRGNLRTAINEANDSTAWLRHLFELCQTNKPDHARVVLAVDTPLGFSDAFAGLVMRKTHVAELAGSETNPYLFRQTEHFLFKHGLKPLSAVKDMIGSQATKGMHVLAKFAPRLERCGVWSDGFDLTVVEAYPSACKGSGKVKAMQESYGKLKHDDLDDALTCALIAHLFAYEPQMLANPPESIPLSEGWIWVPKDGLHGHSESKAQR